MGRVNAQVIVKFILSHEKTLEVVLKNTIFSFHFLNLSYAGKCL
jgi:hypothetical protein